MTFTKEQINHMVYRFLGWKLPANFAPDAGISFKPIGNEGTPYAYRRQPSGTNLFDAVQADAMVRYMIEGMPMEKPKPTKSCGTCALWARNSDPPYCKWQAPDMPFWWFGDDEDHGIYTKETDGGRCSTWVALTPK